MVRPLISVDRDRLRLDLRKLERQFGRYAEHIDEAAAIAISRFAEHLIGRASAKAPTGRTGLLKASAFVGQAVINDEGVASVPAGFNIIYARIQDRGGIVRPTGRPSEVTGKPTTRLFIPLRDDPFVLPGNPGLKRGVDFVLARQARIPGSGYWTNTLRDRIPKATKFMGPLINRLLRELTSEQ